MNLGEFIKKELRTEKKRLYWWRRLRTGTLGKPTISIMTDHGGLPYAWLRPAAKAPPYVGSLTAEADSGFEDVSVSAALETEFKEWAYQWAYHFEEPTFDWITWNLHGIALAKRLKQEVGRKYLVEYHVPSEDPIMEIDSWLIFEISA